MSGGLVHGDDVGIEARDDGQRLLARSAVRLVDGDRLAGLGLPLGGESGIDVLIELARDVIGDVQDCRLREHDNGHQEQEGRGDCAKASTRLQPAIEDCMSSPREGSQQPLPEALTRILQRMLLRCGRRTRNLDYFT